GKVQRTLRLRAALNPFSVRPFLAEKRRPTTAMERNALRRLLAGLRHIRNDSAAAMRCRAHANRGNRLGSCTELFARKPKSSTRSTSASSFEPKSLPGAVLPELDTKYDACILSP